MPNWCSTAVAIYCEKGDKEGLKQLKALLDKLKDVEEHGTPVANGFGNLWLGNILVSHGKEWKDIHCRGVITNYQLQDSSILLWQEDAWTPQVECWETIIQDLYPNLKMVLCGVEPNCDVFVNTDTQGRFFRTRFRLLYEPTEPENSSFGSQGEFYFSSTKKLLKNLRNRAKLFFRSTEEACKWAWNHEIYISKFEEEY